MEIQGIVVQILPPVKGTSARGEWTKQEVILEQKGEFGRKVCVSFWGDKALDAAALKEGENINVSVNIESREYNGRWYTEIRVWKMMRDTSVPMGAGTSQGYNDMPAGDFSGTAATAGGAQGDMPPMPTSEADIDEEKIYDDLPF